MLLGVRCVMCEGGMVTVRTAIALGLMLSAGAARAQNRIVFDEVLGSWLGDDEVQYVELRMLEAGQQALAGIGVLYFDDASGSTDGRRFFGFQQNVANSGNGVKVLVATAKARDQSGVTPDFVLPAGFLRPQAGRVCYGFASEQGIVTVDCVAYGDFTGATGGFGSPTPTTPDNVVLRRSQYTGRNRADWVGALDPVLQANAGTSGALLPTLCGDGQISQGEACDGAALAGASCESLGFAQGKLACSLCQYDVRGCTTCGNGAISGKEECDGGDLGERTCETIGFTGGELACEETCTLTTAGCDPTFFVPGGGPAKTDCLAEWRITNAAGRPKGDGKAPPRQRCRDGDAGCDADGARNGTCVFTVSACFAHVDARLAKCRLAAITGWSLRGRVDPASPATSALVGAVAALGPSSVDGVAVTFEPPLVEVGACAEAVGIAVPARKKLALRARALGPKGKPRDMDTLRLVCAP